MHNSIMIADTLMQVYAIDMATYPNVITDYTIGSFSAFIVRHENGTNLGYVRIPEGHRFYGTDYDDIRANVHGGLTFSSMDEDGSWVIGFDTSHLGDFVPVPAMGSFKSKHYWTHSEVFNELTQLVAQL